MHDRQDRLRRRQRFENVRADGFFLDSRDEGFGGRKRDVGLEQRDPNLAQRVVDLALGNLTFSAQALEYCAEAVAELIEQ